RADELVVAVEAAVTAADAAYASAAARITAKHAERVASAEAQIRERHGADGSLRGEFETEPDYRARIVRYREGLPAFVAEWTPERGRLEKARDDALAQARQDSTDDARVQDLREELSAIKARTYRVAVDTRIGPYRLEDGAFPLALRHERWAVPADALLIMSSDDAEKARPGLGTATAEYRIENGRVIRNAIRIGDGDGYLVHPAKWQQVHRLAGHAGPATGAIFVNGHRRVLTSGADGRLVLWDASNGARVRDIDAHAHAVRFLVVAPAWASRYVASATDREIKLWAARTLAPFRTIDGAHLLPPPAQEEAEDGDAGAGREAESSARRPIAPMISALALSSDSGRLAYAVSRPEPRVVLQDAEGDAGTSVIEGIGAHVHSLAFSPVGMLLAAGLGDGRVVLWQVHEPVEGPKAEAIRGRPARLPRGKLSGLRHAWRPSAAHNARVINAHAGAVLAVAFTHDGTRLITGSRDKTAKMWDAESGDLMQTFARGHGDAITAVGSHVGGRRVLTASRDGNARIWNAETGRAVRGYRGHEGAIVSMAVGSGLLTASEDGSARLWKTGTGWEQRAFRGHTVPSHPVGLSQDGRTMLTFSSGRGPKLWNLVTGFAEDALPPTHSRWHNAALSSDGRLVALAKPGDGVRVTVWDVVAGETVGTFPTGGERAPTLRFADGDRSLLTGTADGPLTLRNVEDLGDGRTVLPGVFPGGPPRIGGGQLLSADGSTSCTFTAPNGARLWDARTGARKAAWQWGTTPARPHALNRDGSRLLGYGQDRRVRLWNADTGVLFDDIMLGTEGGATAAFSPSGAMLVTGSHAAARPSDDTVGGAPVVALKVWSAKTGRLIRELPALLSPVSSIRFAGDDRRVLVAARDVARVYETETGQEVATLESHVGVLRDAAFSDDGSTIVLFTNGGVIDVWRPALVEIP
ncbi:WD40 repeat domain-containing protein, partial [Candidatus Poribacteria bacterium]|nr:WD40 repeat domain-containing protein [Candidatus Poribacteria bacterium]